MAAATTSATGSSLALSGLASGIDWTSIVSELLTIEAAPETQMNTEVSNFQSKNSALQNIGTQLAKLNTDVTTLSQPSFFDSRTASVSNSAVASASADSGTPLGSYNFVIKQLATDAVQQGTAGSSQPLSPTDNVSTLTLSSAGLATAVTAGSFTVNGQSISIATSDTLQSVFDKISTATGGAVTGSYNSSTDEITLAGSGPIVLGSSADTSNFLQAAELYNNGTHTVTSASSLGAVNLSAALSSSNLGTAINDGGAGAGEFTINGVQINYNASSDSVSDVMQRINDSAAGVTATYDSFNDSFDLTSKTTGDVGISLQDVTGNFLAATGLTGGTLQHGANLQYTVNNGGIITSQTNTIVGAASGVSGLSMTALGQGTTTVTVGTDTSTISAKVNSFVADYNVVQTYISGQTASSTSSTGTVTPGLLTGNLDVENIMSNLRQLVGTSPSGATAGIENLTDLGIVSNGTDNTLAASNLPALSTALTNNLAAVKNLFTNPTNGLAATLKNYLTGVTGNQGVLVTDETNLTNETNAVNNSITTLKNKLSSDQTRLTAEFTAMETAISSINTEKQVLSSYFGGSTSNAAPAAAGSGSSSASTSATG